VEEDDTELTTEPVDDADTEAPVLLDTEEALDDDDERTEDDDDDDATDEAVEDD
jgi:hypothetical protein